MNAASIELAMICNSILEDGEISEDELYQLAEWLNEHDEACLEWPGAILVRPLQEAWANGNISKVEIRNIGKILIAIRKDFARYQAEEVLGQAEECAAQEAASMDLANPKIPTIPYVIRVRSESDPSVFYSVDLSGPTCTCPDWRSKRGMLPAGHLGRCCKHVFSALSMLEPENGWPGWLAPFHESSYPPHPSHNWITIKDGATYALISTGTTGWVNSYVSEGGVYERFGYNIEQDRWSYGMEPHNADQIRRIILTSS